MRRFASLCFVLALCLCAPQVLASGSAVNAILDDSSSLPSRGEISGTGRTLAAAPAEEEFQPPLPPEEEDGADGRLDARMGLQLKPFKMKKPIVKRPAPPTVKPVKKKSPPPPRKRSPAPVKKSPPPKKQPSPSPPKNNPAAQPPGPAQKPADGRPLPSSRTGMCVKRNLMSRGIVGGRRYGLKFFHACLNPVPKSMQCCEQCRDAEGCQGWFFTRLDCSAFGGSSNAGVCYLLSDALLAYEDPASWWAGGTQWAAEQSGWNLAQDWDGASAVAFETGQEEDTFELTYG